MSSEGRRVAVVTGASSGIGKAAAELFKSQGLTTIGVSRRSPDTDVTFHCDVQDERSVARVFKRVLDRFGRIDILVNCAGVVAKHDPLTLGAAEWDAILRPNLLGTYWCCKHALKAMRRQRYGKIVNVSSVAGRSYSRTASVAYTSSKYAVIGLTRQLAVHVGRYGVTINCVCPSETKSEMLLRNVPSKRLRALAAAHPLGRLAEPVEVAHAIAFLVSEASSYVNGAVVDVNGGLL